jgi:hypothetical protein
MGMLHAIRPEMASPWRRQVMCVLVAGSASPAALGRVSGGGCFVETPARAEIGDIVELLHPEAGAIRGRVIALAGGGLALSFDGSEQAVAFALAAIGADMSVPH